MFTQTNSTNVEYDMRQYKFVSMYKMCMSYLNSLTVARHPISKEKNIFSFEFSFILKFIFNN